MNEYLLETVDEYPIKIVGGVGSKLIDENGKVYLDFWGDEGVNSLGSRHTGIEHILDKWEMPFHVPKMYGETYRELLAEELVKRSKLEGGKVFFSNSGTEANEAAIKMARVFWYKTNKPYRYNIAILRGNFHGRTGFSLAASDSSDSPYHELGFGPMPVGFYKWSDLDELWRLSKIPGGLAAVMMATVLGNNCIKIYSEEFMDSVKQFCVKTDTLLILDEVQVSMGRTGKFMAYQNYKIQPDIVCVGKGIASGLPLSATIFKPRVARFFEKGMHFSTFGGNALACRIALEVIEYLDNDRLELIKGFGMQIRDTLNNMNFIKYVSGMGIHNSFQIDFDEVPYNGFEFCKEAMRFGLLICTHREKGEIRFTPPVNAKWEEIADGLGSLERIHYSLLEMYKR